MGCCCSSGRQGNLEKHESSFLRIQIIIDEISDFLDGQTHKINPIMEGLSACINNLNFLINQHLDLINEPSYMKELKNLKVITEEKLNSFYNSLILLSEFLKSMDPIKLWQQDSPEFLSNIKEKMVEVQYNLNNLLNQAILVVFPTVVNKNQALKGVYKKDFDAILSYFQELFKLITEKKDIKIDLVKEFSCVLSCFFWLNNFCLQGDQKLQFQEFATWVDFKKGFRRFVEETIQIELSETELAGIKAEIDTFQINLIFYKDWDIFFSKTWSNFRKRNYFLKRYRNFNEDKNLAIRISSSSEGKQFEAIISEQDFEVNGIKQSYKYENYLLTEAICFGNSESDHVKVEANFERKSFFKIFVGYNNRSKDFYIVNSNETHQIKYILAQKPFLLTKGLIADIEGRYILEIGDFEIDPTTIDFNLLECTIPDAYLHVKSGENKKEINFKPELLIKIFDKKLNKKKEVELNLLDVQYKICCDINELTITPKNVDLEQVYAEINYLSEKRVWVMQKSSKAQGKYVQILPFSFKLGEKTIFAGKKLENLSMFSYNGIIFSVLNMLSINAFYSLESNDEWSNSKSGIESSCPEKQHYFICNYLLIVILLYFFTMKENNSSKQLESDPENNKSKKTENIPNGNLLSQ